MDQYKLMIEATMYDFNVRPIGSKDNFTLLGALRDGHPAGVWHFVLLHLLGDKINSIQQLHIPRFRMIEALHRLDNSYPSESYEKPLLVDWMPFPAFIHGRNKISFVTNDKTELMIDESFVQQMREDLHFLETAKTRVQSVGNGFGLPDAKTPNDNPVESDSERLLQAIAFEQLTMGRLDARNFGIFSAFCTYRDFDTSIMMNEELIMELVEGQFQYKPMDVDPDTVSLFMGVQRKILSQPIWGHGITMNKALAAQVLSKGMDSLTRSQRVQFILMNGMHGAGLFLPLACVTGAINFNKYASLVCQGFQPDSVEEQDRRKESAYIELYGQLESKG
jgi:hypothetical protein